MNAWTTRLVRRTASTTLPAFLDFRGERTKPSSTFKGRWKLMSVSATSLPQEAAITILEVCFSTLADLTKRRCIFAWPLNRLSDLEANLVQRMCTTISAVSIESGEILSRRSVGSRERVRLTCDC